MHIETKTKKACSNAYRNKNKKKRAVMHIETKTKKGPHAYMQHTYMDIHTEQQTGSGTRRGFLSIVHPQTPLYCQAVGKGGKREKTCAGQCARQ